MQECKTVLILPRCYCRLPKPPSTTAHVPGVLLRSVDCALRRLQPSFTDALVTFVAPYSSALLLPPACLFLLHGYFLSNAWRPRFSSRTPSSRHSHLPLVTRTRLLSVHSLLPLPFNVHPATSVAPALYSRTLLPTAWPWSARSYPAHTCSNWVASKSSEAGNRRL